MRIISIVLSIFVCNLAVCNSYTTFRIVNGNFSTSDVGTCVKPFYKLKPVNRYRTVLSAGCTRITRTLSKIYIRCNIEYKRIGNYRKLMSIDFFDLCNRLLNKENKFYDFILEWIIPKDFIQPCPYKDDQFKLINLTHPPIRYTAWPDGFYRTTLTLKDDIDYNIFSTTSVMRVTSKDNIVEF